jgi:hypothetical protein
VPLWLLVEVDCGEAQLVDGFVDYERGGRGNRHVKGGVNQPFIGWAEIVICKISEKPLSLPLEVFLIPTERESLLAALNECCWHLSSFLGHLISGIETLKEGI